MPHSPDVTAELSRHLINAGYFKDEDDEDLLLCLEGENIPDGVRADPVCLSLNRTWVDAQLKILNELGEKWSSFRVTYYPNQVCSYPTSLLSLSYFRSLFEPGWQLTEKEKAEVDAAYAAMLQDIQNWGEKFAPVEQDLWGGPIPF